MEAPKPRPAGHPDAGEYQDNSPAPSRATSVGTSASSRSDTTPPPAVKDVPAPTKDKSAYVPPHLRRIIEATEQATLELKLIEAGQATTAIAETPQKSMGVRTHKVGLPYFLRKPQLAEVVDRYPRTEFYCTDDKPHDHPILHTDTIMARSMLNRLVPAGDLAVPIFGSPVEAAKANKGQLKSTNPKSFMAVTAFLTEKDYIRDLDYGDEESDGVTRFVRTTQQTVCSSVLAPSGDTLEAKFGLKPKQRVSYLLDQKLYYLSDEQIATLLAVPKSRMLAVIHRHQHDDGSLGLGEATYAKKHGMVEQTNVLTGERYRHRDLSYFWESTSKVRRTSCGSFTWTFHMVSRETWILRLTACPNLDERFTKRVKDVGLREAVAEHNEHDVAPTPFPHPSLSRLPGAACKMVGGIAVVSFPDRADFLPLRVTCPELLEFLCMSMVGKPRTPERLADLFSLSRSHAASGSDFTGKRNFKIEARDVNAHVGLAWIGGIREETELLRSLSAFTVYVREHRAHLDGAALVVDSACPETAGATAHAILGRINVARKSGDAISAILELTK